MSAIAKLRRALAPHRTRNVDPHEELVFVGQFDEQMGLVNSLTAQPERESWQDDTGEDEPEPITLFDMFCVLDELKELEARPPVEKPAEDVATDPHARYMQILAKWEDDKIKLAYYKEQEAIGRTTLFETTFPNPVEGTQKFKLSDGRTVKGQYKINRKIDEAALPVTLAHMRELGVANTDALVTYKPSLAKREWNTLSPDLKIEFSAAIIATPGMPGFEIEMPKALK